jgi:hypothetical protein
MILISNTHASSGRQPGVVPPEDPPRLAGYIQPVKNLSAKALGSNTAPRVRMEFPLSRTVFRCGI